MIHLTRLRQTLRFYKSHALVLKAKYPGAKISPLVKADYLYRALLGKDKTRIYAQPK